MEVEATIAGLRPYLIHGERYVTVFFETADDPESFQQTSLSEDALPKGLKVGDPVRILYLGSVVAGIQALEV
jgi:hypothetical protein